MRVFSSCLNVFTRNSSPSLELDTPLTRDKLSAKIVRNSPYCEVKHDNGLKETLVQKLSALNDKQKDSFIEICNTLLIGLREEWHNPNLATEYEGKGSKFFACVRGEYQSNTINITEIGVIMTTVKRNKIKLF